MELLKALFAEGALDWEQFSAKVKEAGYKLADLSKGEYVSTAKYNDELNAKDTQINNLTEQITKRDADLQTLNDSLSKLKDNEGEATALREQLTKLQEDYATAKTDYEQKLNTAKYEYAVKDFANNQHFTSAAAKRDFIRSMVSSNLQMDNDKILGATDYLDKYKKDNADSFKVEESDKKPKFVDKTTGQQGVENKNPFLDAMNFTPIRPKPSDK